MSLNRKRFEIDGVVQGVGFRPYVHRLAVDFGLTGWVKNEGGRVVIEVEGPHRIPDEFILELQRHVPPLARIDDVRCVACPPLHEDGFRIDESSAGISSDVFICPDVATCCDCLRELFNPRNRRYRYPFLNCTNCGPRLTIIQGAPYDRVRTTMRAFEMCAECRREYEDPLDRRFHAQPTACPCCGPQAQLIDNAAEPIEGDDAISTLSRLLKAGAIAAVKGLGGYHLACDAMNAQAIRQLRERKHREEKPFAIMVANLVAAERICDLSDADRAMLELHRAPIVLLRKKDRCDVAAEVAPGNPCLGVMLPCTPLHHLLMRDLAALGGGALVMTSGNRSDEPIATDDADALARLAGIADVFLTHDRAIHVRCDDSVMRNIRGRPLPIRRSRGYAPEPLTLPKPCPFPLLAVGAQLKATFALGRDRQAFISHHLGDLDHHEACRAFARDIELYQDLFGIKPEAIAHDVHPDYSSTRYALQRASAEGLPTIAVQHHHAHMAACMAEHGLTSPVIGVTFDGSGYGTDGTIWGGEFLIGDYQTFTRAAHLRPIAMPGGEQAVRNPWRMALACLIDAGLDPQPLAHRIPPAQLSVVERMIERQLNCPMTSSAGRLFDAVASLCSLRDRVSYEGQAAVELEWAAQRSADVLHPFAFEIHRPCAAASLETKSADECGPLVVDTRPLIREVTAALSRSEPVAVIARRFHATIAALITEVCQRLAGMSGIADIVLSGGVFANALLLQLTTAQLTRAGLSVFSHHQVPPNDGGLSLGQLAVAAALQETAPQSTRRTRSRTS